MRSSCITLHRGRGLSNTDHKTNEMFVGCDVALPIAKKKTIRKTQNQSTCQRVHLMLLTAIPSFTEQRAFHPANADSSRSVKQTEALYSRQLRFSPISSPKRLSKEDPATHHIIIRLLLSLILGLLLGLLWRSLTTCSCCRAACRNCAATTAASGGDRGEFGGAFGDELDERVSVGSPNSSGKRRRI